MPDLQAAKNNGMQAMELFPNKRKESVPLCCQDICRGMSNHPIACAKHGIKWQKEQSKKIIKKVSEK